MYMTSITKTIIQPTNKTFVWGVEGFYFADLVMESMYFHVCSKVFQLVAGICPFLIHHCFWDIKVAPNFVSLPFPFIQLFQGSGGGQQ
jgi:hypothetical protein